jgi:hypothetical protein
MLPRVREGSNPRVLTTFPCHADLPLLSSHTKCLCPTHAGTSRVGERRATTLVLHPPSFTLLLKSAESETQPYCDYLGTDPCIGTRTSFINAQYRPRLTHLAQSIMNLTTQFFILCAASSRKHPRSPPHEEETVAIGRLVYLPTTAQAMESSPNRTSYYKY